MASSRVEQYKIVWPGPLNIFISVIVPRKRSKGLFTIGETFHHLKPIGFWWATDRCHRCIIGFGTVFVSPNIRYSFGCSFDCVLCQTSEEETVDHLFLNCQFSRDCWNSIGVAIQNDTVVLQAVRQIKDQAHPSFMLTIILMCWSIWTVRNDLIFNGVQPSVPRAKEIYKKRDEDFISKGKGKAISIF
jgi:hypothetical protein